ncbi:MAG TPA: hypothetical protein VJB06_00090 [archaeon]|nr:hypothetical protein [archaeon]
MRKSNRYISLVLFTTLVASSELSGCAVQIGNIEFVNDKRGELEVNIIRDYEPMGHRKREGALARRPYSF